MGLSIKSLSEEAARLFVGYSYALKDLPSREAAESIAQVG
jgi:hypothetical protein